QTIEQALLAPNATRGPGAKIEVGIQPGTEFKYSGGGYLILQLLVEEVSGQSFKTYMQQAVFRPLEMSRSTYSRPADGVLNVALSYNSDGTPGITYNFTAVSASGLYTTTSDMTKFIQAHLVGATGSALSPQTLSAMREPYGYNSGMEIWGLGTILYAANGEGGFAFGHDGKNDPAINATTRVNPATGDGFILLETGNDLLATNLGSEWTFWQTGKIDILTIASAINGMVKIIIPGWIVIVLLGLFAGWRMRTQPGKPA
ncbi:MAG TPA: class A beta-lactamase-related serine hydrolase, partial [Pseudomonadales bacterium]|nr:class A beta-lactamase-related serine hydrolase [Pseudomonadales bacterium]